MALVNRNASAVDVRLALPADTGRLRRYVYRPQDVPAHPFGDLPGPEAVVTPAGGVLQASLPGTSLVVYTSAFEDAAPGAVSGLAAAPVEGGTRLSWQASAEPDVRYYRVYRRTPEGRRQIGSTVANSFLDRADAGPAGAGYAVTAVDLSGNEGP